ncbi:MAG: hypothetical protein ACRDPD_18500, partial [Streptosporangiaceae bacterium]
QPRGELVLGAAQQRHRQQCSGGKDQSGDGGCRVPAGRQVVGGFGGDEGGQQPEGNGDAALGAPLGCLRESAGAG